MATATAWSGLGRKVGEAHPVGARARRGRGSGLVDAGGDEAKGARAAFVPAGSSAALFRIGAGSPRRWPATIFGAGLVGMDAVGLVERIDSGDALQQEGNQRQVVGAGPPPGRPRESAGRNRHRGWAGPPSRRARSVRPARGGGWNRPAPAGVSPSESGLWPRRPSLAPVSMTRTAGGWLSTQPIRRSSSGGALAAHPGIHDTVVKPGASRASAGPARDRLRPGSRPSPAVRLVPRKTIAGARQLPRSPGGGTEVGRRSAPGLASPRSSRFQQPEPMSRR